MKEFFVKEKTRFIDIAKLHSKNNKGISFVTFMKMELRRREEPLEDKMRRGLKRLMSHTK